MSLFPAYVLAPHCPKNSSWSNLVSNKNNSAVSLGATPNGTMTLLAELVKNLPIDTYQIYLTGLFSGGLGTYIREGKNLSE